MMAHRSRTLLLIAILTQPLSAASWDEAVDGDLSSSPESPTLLSFEVGDNLVSGTMVAPDDVRDFLTFTIPEGQQLSRMYLVQYFDVEEGTAGNLGYHALNEGNFSFIPSGGNSSSFLGGDHLSLLPDQTDVLSILSEAPLAGTGFSTPLGTGDYSYVIQQTGPELTGYTLNFVVTSVPEPSASGAIYMVAGLWLFKQRRRRK